MRKGLIALVFAVLMLGCGGSEKYVPAPPSAAVLIFPDNNAACISGVYESPSESTVSFSWNASANTNAYKLYVKNLLKNSVIEYNADKPGLDVSLLQNTPYSWYVVSYSNQVTATATSDTWKFYNSGPGIVSHPPFPAELLTPTYAQVITAPASGKVTLTWDDSDVDNDLASYDVYMGTSSTPPLLQSGVTAKTFDVNVTGGTTYYWMIVAKDSKGNTSASDIYQFAVN